MAVGAIHQRRPGQHPARLRPRPTWWPGPPAPGRPAIHPAVTAAEYDYCDVGWPKQYPSPAPSRLTHWRNAQRTRRGAGRETLKAAIKNKVAVNPLSAAGRGDAPALRHDDAVTQTLTAVGADGCVRPGTDAHAISRVPDTVGPARRVGAIASRLSAGARPLRRSGTPSWRSPGWILVACCLFWPAYVAGDLVFAEFQVDVEPGAVSGGVEHRLAGGVHDLHPRIGR